MGTKVLHVFYTFLPDLTGSSIRSAGIISGQTAHGMNVAAISSPFQPGFGAGRIDTFAGVRVYRAYRNDAPRITEKGSSVVKRLRKVTAFPAFVKYIRSIAYLERATVIHAHSTFYCGIASFIAARSLGIGVVYEFRSLWEERSRGLGGLYRVQAAICRWMETVALRLADRVVVINRALKDEVVSRGVSPDRIDIVPNAVDERLIHLGSTRNPAHRIRSFGYIGNLSSIEGLDLLVLAFQKAFPNEEGVRLIFHGGGPFEPQLRALINAANDSRIQLRGRFAREDIADVYDTVDCVVIPRHRSKLNDTVTPLKPLEAMAFKRVVAVSDARGLIEVIGDVSNACVFPADDVDALAETLRQLYSGEINGQDIAERGFKFVSKARVWQRVARLYKETYAKC